MENRSKQLGTELFARSEKWGETKALQLSGSIADYRSPDPASVKTRRLHFFRNWVMATYVESDHLGVMGTYLNGRETAVPSNSDRLGDIRWPSKNLYTGAITY